MAQPMISVETVLQITSGACASEYDGIDAGVELIRQQHLIPAGTTVRGLLLAAGMVDAIAAVEANELGLSSHGKRVWLDDETTDADRVELMEPVRADAKAERAQRVTADRARRKTRFGRT